MTRVSSLNMSNTVRLVSKVACYELVEIARTLWIDAVRICSRSCVSLCQVFEWSSSKYEVASFLPFTDKWLWMWIDCVVRNMVTEAAWLYAGKFRFLTITHGVISD